YSYYLFANTSTFNINGSSVAADAYYSDSANTACSPAPPASHWDTASTPKVKKLADVGCTGDFYLLDSGGAVIDAVGWARVSAGEPPSDSRGTPIQWTLGWPAAGEQLVRISSPAANLSISDMNTYARAYNSRDNHADFYYATPVSPGLP